MNLNIRKARKSDVVEIMALVNELALFEKAPEEVTNTESQMLLDGFGDNPLFHCIVAESDAGILGFALFYYRYSTWKGKVLYLEDFYVKEEFRNFGIGKKLFDAAIDAAKTSNCKRISWQVLDWNTPAIKFYEKYSAGFDKGWWNGFIDLN